MPDVTGLGTRSRPSDQEYVDRLTRVLDRMATRSLSALVVTDPANLFYLTGYNAWSFYMPQCLVVTAGGDLHLFARAMDAAGAHFTCILSADQVSGYPEHLVHREDVHPFEWIADRACESGLLDTSSDSKIAVESDAHFFSPRGYLALAERVAPARLVDSHELVNWVRVVKSPFEIEQMRSAGAIAELSMRRALSMIVPGVRQCDVVAEVLSAQATGMPEYGGDYPAIVPLLPSGEAAGTPHLTWSDSTFVAGEATTVELAGVYGRYHAPLARTICLGRPPKRLRTAASVVRDGMAASLDSLKPGATGADVHAAFNTVISAHGLVKESRTGYSIGIGYPPDWGEHTVSLRAEEETVLEPGMTFHVILGMWMDGWGYELSEPVVVGDSGAERLTNLAQELSVRR